jgi:hypothetical protein
VSYSNQTYVLIAYKPSRVDGRSSLLKNKLNSESIFIYFLICFLICFQQLYKSEIYMYIINNYRYLCLSKFQSFSFNLFLFSIILFFDISPAIHFYCKKINWFIIIYMPKSDIKVVEFPGLS